MKRVEHLLLTSYLLPTFLGAQGVASASFLETTPDTQSAGMVGTGLTITGNGSTAIFHNASAIAFSQGVMGTSYSYADINKDLGMYSTFLFYRIGREGKHGFSVGFRRYRDAGFYWQDGAEDHARAWNVEAAYFGNVARNLSLSLTLRYLQTRAYKDADSKGSVSVNLDASYRRNMGILDEMAPWTIGLQAVNLGSKLDGQKLPTRLGLSGAVDLPFSTDSRLQVTLDFNYLLPSKYRHLQADVGAGYNFLRCGVTRGGYHFEDNDKGAGDYGTLGCGINLWPIRANFSYALADKDCFMHKTWQLGIGIVFQAFPSGSPSSFIIEQSLLGPSIEQSAVFFRSAVCQIRIRDVTSLRPQALRASVPDEEK